MAKRLTDTMKWSKPFIRSMEAPYKLLWLYILDECDHAGIWQVDFEVAQIRTGEKLELKKAMDFFTGKIQPFSNGEKWFIPGFIDFQYGQLKIDNRAHNSVINVLSKYNLIDENFKPLPSTFQGDKDMDKDKDKELDKDLDKEAEFSQVEIWPTFMDFWNLYEKKIGDRVKLEKKWVKIPQVDKEVIMRHIPLYKLAQPNKKYRKNPETYLNNKGWLDEIIHSDINQSEGKGDKIQELLQRIKKKNEPAN